jgi:transcriptional regulator with XRE-family HTH domain
MPNKERNPLGLFLEKLRGKMPLREVATKSGLSHTYIRDLELGINRKTKAPINPTPETLKRLAEAYNYSYEDLMIMAGYIEKQEEDLEHHLALSRIKEEALGKQGSERAKLLNEAKDWGDLIDIEEFMRNIELSDEELLSKYNFTYRGKKLDDDKTKQILDFIRFISEKS